MNQSLSVRIRCDDASFVLVSCGQVVAGMSASLNALLTRSVDIGVCVCVCMQWYAHGAGCDVTGVSISRCGDDAGDAEGDGGAAVFAEFSVVNRSQFTLSGLVLTVARRNNDAATQPAPTIIAAPDAGDPSPFSSGACVRVRVCVCACVFACLLSRSSAQQMMWFPWPVWMLIVEH